MLASVLHFMPLRYECNFKALKKNWCIGPVPIRNTFQSKKLERWKYLLTFSVFMSSSTFCLHGYSKLYFSFIPRGIWAFEQIHTTLILLTHKNHHKLFNANFFNTKNLFCENQYFSWTPRVLGRSFSYFSQHLLWEDVTRERWAAADWEAIQETPCFYGISS